MDNIKINLKKIDSSFMESDKDINEYINNLDDERISEIINEKYSSLDYPIRLESTTDECDSYFIAEHPDLPGCVTHGSTREEALSNLDDARLSWIYTALSVGEEIPKAGSKNEINQCSGKILLRVPKELHYKLLKKAKEDDTSLNQELLFLISSALGTFKSADN